VTAVYLGAVDKVMCSKECPCPYGPGNTYKELWESTENTVLSKYNRAKNIGAMTTK
jgi:hypothetical protein